jgi:hypothetical protein
MQHGGMGARHMVDLQIKSVDLPSEGRVKPVFRRAVGSAEQNDATGVFWGAVHSHCSRQNELMIAHLAGQRRFRNAERCSERRPYNPGEERLAQCTHVTRNPDDAALRELD